MRFRILTRALALLGLLALPSLAVGQGIQILSSTGTLVPIGTISTSGADCTTATACISFSVDGVPAFGVYLDVGTTGTFVFEKSADATTSSDGAWFPIDDQAGDANATADGLYSFNNSGFRRFRLRASAISGTASTLAVRGFNANGSVTIGDVSVDTTGLLTSTNFAAAFGTAGVPDSQVMSVQFCASCTAFQGQSNNADLFTFGQGGTLLEDTAAIRSSAAALAAAATPVPGQIAVNIVAVKGSAPLDPLTTDFHTGGTTTTGELFGIGVPGASGVVPIGGTSDGNLYATIRNATNSMPAMDAVGRAGFVKITDGTNTAPTLDAVGRAGFFKLTDGTNTAPTFDAVARAGFVKLTDGTNTQVIDPCSANAKTYLPVNISTATTTELTPSLAGASNHYYVCAIDIGTDAANNVALVDDDSDGCGSVTSGLAGGTTAASGWHFLAGGGETQGSGLGSLKRTNGTNRVLCLVTSANTQLSGTISVVAAP